MTEIASPPPDGEAILLFRSECGSAGDDARAPEPPPSEPDGHALSRDQDSAVQAVAGDVAALRAELGLMRERAARMAGDSQRAFALVRDACAECGRVLAAATSLEQRLLALPPVAASTCAATPQRTWAVRYGHVLLLGLGVSAVLLLMRASLDGGLMGPLRPLPSRPISIALAAVTLRGQGAEVVSPTTAGESSPGVTLVAESRRRVSQFNGTLIVNSKPAGATVFIDRRPAGETPLRVARLPARSHAVWVEREGHERWTAAVLVSAGSLTRVDAMLHRSTVPFANEHLPRDRAGVGQGTSEPVDAVLDLASATGR